MNVNIDKRDSIRPSQPRGSEAAPSVSTAPAHDRWTPVEQVVLDLDLPHIAIARALEQSDDPAIWREYAKARDEDGFLDCLARLAGSYSTQEPHFRDVTRDTQWRHVLVAVPFLLPATAWPVAAPARDDRGGAAELVGELQHWAGYQQQARTMLGCVKYVDLCRWSPVTQREHLQLLAGERGGASVPREPPVAEIPAAFPQPAFAIASVRCWNAPPQLPDAFDESAQGWELRSRMAGCLSYANQRSVRPHQVMLPAPLREAVLSGLQLWLGELARQQLVGVWDVQPGPKDTVRLQLAGAGEEGLRVELPLRLHQIGRDGLSVLMGDLGRHFGAPQPAARSARARGVTRWH